MAGLTTDKEKLNHTLKKVCDVLRVNGVDSWFIMFGTLLGVVRENSCIQGDDDLDILIHYDYKKLRTMFEDEGFVFTSNYGIKNPDWILKSEPCEQYGSFDFYMCVVNNKNYFTPWQNVEVQNVSIEKKEWNTTVVNMPSEPVTRLEKMYGADWKTPVEYNPLLKRQLVQRDTIYNIFKKSIV